MKNPCFETLRTHDVKFRKACELSVRTREASKVRVKYRNFSLILIPDLDLPIGAPVSVVLPEDQRVNVALLDLSP